MVRTFKASGYEEYRSMLNTFEKEAENTQIDLYFIGKKDESGQNWCPDCNDAESYVMEALSAKPLKDSIFLVVDVGDRTAWKDMQNQFRKDENLKLSEIPTLMRYKETARLEGSKCADSALLQKYFFKSSS